eukprot:7746782-Prorocentrum_lima.AAC.1
MGQDSSVVLVVQGPHPSHPDHQIPGEQEAGPEETGQQTAVQSGWRLQDCAGQGGEEATSVGAR